MNTNLSLLFYLKKPKNYVKGEIPIYLRITISGKRAEVSTGRSCEPKRWNANAGRAIGTKEEVRILNNYLSELQKKALETHLQMIQNNLPISASSFRDAFTGKGQKEYLLMEILLEHNERMAALVGNGFAANTLKGYRTTEKHLFTFLKSKLKLVDIDIRQINLEFINDYEFFLRSEMGCSDVSAAKYMKHFRKIVNHCLNNGWLAKSPFTNYKNKAKPKEREFLTQSEVEQIFNKKFLVPRISQVKDIFLFCCYTGLSYADVRKLRRSEITIGANGKHWIFTKREKTGTATRIPLLPPAQVIIDKYADHPQCSSSDLLLPVSSNQKMNAYLKEIADLCGIDKRLTFHMARHTFATTITSNNGVPIEIISSMLGHTDLKTTQHYAKILDIKIGSEMDKLALKLG